MLEKVRAFVSKEAVLVVAVLAAAVSCALVPFDEGYASYVIGALWHFCFA